MSNDLIKLGVTQKAYPRQIYKYRVENDEKTERIITANELWFSNPLLFNDPFDCNTPIDIHTSIEEIKKWLISAGVANQNIDNLADKLKRTPDYMKLATENAISNLGVCCFSTIDDNILQWSHYSNYHKGICLQFDISEDTEFFMIPVIVAYRKVMQHYNHFCHSDKIIEYLIKPKFSEWSYESEIRIVKPAEIIKNNGNRLFNFKDNALKEVIFGIKTPDGIIEKYKKLCCDNNKKHVRFFKMELGIDTHYQLIKKLI